MPKAGHREQQALLDRRQWLGLGALGLTLPRLLWSEAATRPARPKSCVLFFLQGSPSQLDVWDLKPDAPAEVRGEFKSIATSVAGVRLCEHLPRLARLADRYTIIRSMSHDDLDHGSAIYLSLTGQFHPRKSSNFPPRPEDAPALGAILQRIQP